MALVTCLLLAADVAARAEESAPAPPAPAPAKPSAQERALQARLRTRATEWLNARTGLVLTCPTCDGSGWTAYLAGGRTVRRSCGACGGDGKKVSRVQGRKIYYDLRTPQWRLRETAQAEADSEYKSSWKQLHLRSWRIDRVELVGERHGVVHVVEGTDSVARPSRWVLAPEGKTQQWFLWTEGTDEPWPAPARTDDEVHGGDAGVEALPELQAILLDGLLRRAETSYRAVERGRSGRTLVLRLELDDRPVRHLREATVRSDAIALVRAIYPPMRADWDAIQLVFTVEWQDRFGERKRMPASIVSLSAEVFFKIRWDNLSEEEAFALFQAREVAYEGWQMLLR